MSAPKLGAVQEDGLTSAASRPRALVGARNRLRQDDISFITPRVLDVLTKAARSYTGSHAMRLRTNRLGTVLGDSNWSVEDPENRRRPEDLPI